MRESGLEQIGHVFLDESLIADGVCRVQCHTDLTLLHQIKHVSQDRRVHRQTWKRHRSYAQEKKKKPKLLPL